VFCQLEVLRHCLPASIRQTLDHLPESLDETCVHVLRQIPPANRAHAHRMLQCLMVAIRPLRVEELAELLAFEFERAQQGIPKYRVDWRLDDQTQAVLSTCSSLVTIIMDKRFGHEVVQYSHFSVKEFLMSNRLGSSSQYHIHPASAHTILTQASLGSLLHLDNHIGKNGARRFPLSQYAAEHWVEHAQFENVASCVKDGIETLFDSDKPHFAAWIGIYDMDERRRDYWSHFSDSESPPTLHPKPLYYSVLCGFYDLVKHLAIKHPQHVNAIWGRYRYPLFAALSKGRLEVAELLLEHGANVNARETTGETVLLQLLSQSSSRPRLALLSPHNLVKYERPVEVAQLLVRNNADVNYQGDDGKTPLHLLSESQIDEAGVLNLALLLLKHGAELNTRDKDNETPLHLAVGRDRTKLAEILLEHGADATAEDNKGRTILHRLLSESRNDDEGGVINLALLLLKHGAGVNRQDEDNETPFHLAVGRDRTNLAVILLEHGADATAEDNKGRTILHRLLVSESRNDDEGDVINLALLLLKHGAGVNRQDEDNKTPLHLAVRRDRSELALILLEHGADANAEDIYGKTPLHILSECQVHHTSGVGNVLEPGGPWSEHGAEVGRQYENYEPPIIRVHCSAENETGETPVHQVSRRQYGPRELSAGVVQLVPEPDVDIDVQERDHVLRSNFGLVRIVQALLDHGANVNAGRSGGETSFKLYQELEGEYQIQCSLRITQLAFNSGFP
jgi:ankyrin repeat protein